MAEQAQRDGALEVSPDGVVVYADGGARALLGEDIVGHSVDDLCLEGREEIRASRTEVSGGRVVLRVCESTRIDLLVDEVRARLRVLPKVQQGLMRLADLEDAAGG